MWEFREIITAIFSSGVRIHKLRERESREFWIKIGFLKKITK